MSSFSIWLLLEKESRSNYRQIVKTISKRLKAPIFEPHCTIYGHLNTDIEILKPFVTELAKNYNQFSASVKKIKSGGQNATRRSNRTWNGIAPCR